MLLLYRLSHRLLLLLLLLQTRLAIYTLCVQYTKQDRNAQCNVRIFFYDAFFLMYFLAADSKWSNKFLGGYFVCLTLYLELFPSSPQFKFMFSALD